MYIISKHLIELYLNHYYKNQSKMYIIILKSHLNNKKGLY